VRTVDGSGKVKRIQANARVKVVPCDVQGAVLGVWVKATASLVSRAEHERIDGLFDAKYGAIKKQFESQTDLQGLVYSTILIQLDAPNE